jgi:hypothetical protein
MMSCSARFSSCKSLVLAPFSPQIIATALLLLLFLCFIAQTAVLMANRRLWEAVVQSAPTALYHVSLGHRPRSPVVV